MGDFLARGGVDERWEDDDWFKRLVGVCVGGGKGRGGSEAV